MAATEEMRRERRTLTAKKNHARSTRIASAHFLHAAWIRTVRYQVIIAIDGLPKLVRIRCTEERKGERRTPMAKKNSPKTYDSDLSRTGEIHLHDSHFLHAVWMRNVRYRVVIKSGQTHRGEERGTKDSYAQKRKEHCGTMAHDSGLNRTGKVHLECIFTLDVGWMRTICYQVVIIEYLELVRPTEERERRTENSYRQKKKEKKKTGNYT
ncbi:hypothetical protein B0H16DRAFT_1457337 [Mycena metata]|uniref:Uncharacterized protein n=1 Tax=Mycena metata TaxID=1033252 RepID=A0AAD7J6P1_9AGAR|nr:hypothetical protein B0H16DRAFT_1457337 [Mycena metata]